MYRDDLRDAMAWVKVPETCLLQGDLNKVTFSDSYCILLVFSQMLNADLTLHLMPSDSTWQPDALFTSYVGLLP